MTCAYTDACPYLFNHPLVNSSPHLDLHLSNIFVTTLDSSTEQVRIRVNLSPYWALMWDLRGKCCFALQKKSPQLTLNSLYWKTSVLILMQYVTLYIKRSQLIVSSYWCRSHFLLMHASLLPADLLFGLWNQFVKKYISHNLWTK